MKRAKHKGFIVTLTIMLMLSAIFSEKINSYAEDSILCIINNECRLLSDSQAWEIWGKIESDILNVYNIDDYMFENTNVTFRDVQIGETEYVIDVDVISDITLIENPEESDYVKGMKEAIAVLSDADEKANAEYILQDKLEQFSKSYNKVENTGFLYRISIPTVTTYSTTADYNMFYRVDISSSETIVCDVEENEQRFNLTKEDGKAFIENLNESSNKIRLLSITFDENAAVAYAIANATAEPEFNSSNGGSDCANFVSKCLNAGGIPVDQTGKWYPTTVWGNTSTCGINWMRTGYYNNGGVVPYMEENGYLFEITGTADIRLSSVMSWNNTSHVAMVTSIDANGNIKYSEHSNVQKSAVYYSYVPASHDVTFYVDVIY